MSVLVAARSSSEVPEGLMNNPVYTDKQMGMMKPIHDYDYVNMSNTELNFVF